MRTALVTGANRGIGIEVARRLARAGLAVLLGARAAAAGRRAADALRGEGLAVRAEPLDVADPAGVEACVARLAAAGTAVDVLVNNAAIYPAGDALAAPWSEVEEVLATNLLGPWRLARALLPGMLARGYGRVVMLSSGSGSFASGLGGPGAYCVSKAGLNALTVKLAQLAVGDVKVNAVDPGWVRTQMGGEEAPRSVEQGADTVVWLATLPADGPNGGFFRDRGPIRW